MKPAFPSLMKTLFCTTLCCVLFLAAGGARAQAELYDLNETDVHYTSEGADYTLTLNTPQDMLRSGSRGEYWIEDWAQSGWDVYFDYDEETGIFTLYKNAVPYQRLQFLEFDELLVDELVNGHVVDSTLYKKGADDIYSAYVASVGSTWTLDRYLTDALEIFDDEGPTAIAASPVSYTSNVPGDGSMRDFILQRTPGAAAPTSHGGRYMLISDDNEDEWITFSYDADTGVFTMYDEISGDEPYAYRKFSADYSQLETQSTSSRHASGMFYREADGIYHGSTIDIYKYVTDGMLIFLNNVKK